MPSPVWEELSAAPKSCCWGIETPASQAELKTLPRELRPHQSCPQSVQAAAGTPGPASKGHSLVLFCAHSPSRGGISQPPVLSHPRAKPSVCYGWKLQTNMWKRQKVNILSTVCSSQVFHTWWGTPAAGAWRDQCLCTHRELRIGSGTSQSSRAAQLSPSANPQHPPGSELWGTKTSMKQECSFSHPLLPALSPLCCGSALPPFPRRGLGLLHTFLWGLGAETSRCSPHCQPQLGVLVVLSPSPRPSADFSFPISWTEVLPLYGLHLGKPLKVWFNQGCVSQPRWHN